MPSTENFMVVQPVMAIRYPEHLNWEKVLHIPCVKVAIKNKGDQLNAAAVIKSSKKIYSAVPSNYETAEFYATNSI